MDNQQLPQKPLQPANSPPQPLAQPFQQQTMQPLQNELEDPGKTLGIISLVCALVNIGVVGLITGIIGLKKSKAAGRKNGLALAGIIISIVGIVISSLLIVFMVMGVKHLYDRCGELGQGVHYADGGRYVCAGNSVRFDTGNYTPSTMRDFNDTGYYSR